MTRPRRLFAGILIMLWLAGCNTPSTPRPTVSPTPEDKAGTTIPATPGEWTLVTRAPSAPIPSPTPACGADAPPTRMIVGEHGRVLDDDPRPLNVRMAAGTDNRVLGQLQIREVFMVLDGPQCAGDYVWYFIQRGDLQGWVAEGDFALYYIAPYLPG